MIEKGAAARLDVTAAQIADYLRPVNPETRKRGDRPKAAVLEVLIVEDGMAYVRWPTGAVRWQTTQSLRDRGFTVPTIGLLQTRPA